MDLDDIQRAANIIFRMCEEHPEICPHDYIPIGCGETPDGKFENRYRCTICGSTKSDIYD